MGMGNPSGIGRYHASWFDQRHGANCEVVVLAQSERQVESYVDSLCLPQYRRREFWQAPVGDNKDTLYIDWIEAVDFPYQISSVGPVACFDPEEAGDGGE